MKHFLAALQFITILPIGGKTPFVPHRMVPFFPLVGLVIGAGLVVVDSLAARLFPQPLSGLLDVAYLIAVTGAFHLDGLGDTADGIFSHRSREQALVIMKDSRVGMMGVVAVILCLSFKWAAIGAVSSERVLTLLLVPMLARGGLLYAMKELPYGRPDGGTGRAFFDVPLSFRHFKWVLACLWPVLFMGLRGIFLVLGFAGLTLFLTRFFRRRMGCITGDMLGAMVEVTETGLFLLAAFKPGAGT